MSNVIPVLLYYSVTDSPLRRDLPYSVSPAGFAEHAAAVAASGRVALCITELAAALRSERSLPERAGAVTFDAVSEPGAVPTHRVLVGAAVITAIAVMCLGALWELVEWVADSTVATNYSQGYDDTIVDLWADAIAAGGAGALVAGWLRGQAEADR